MWTGHIERDACVCVRERETCISGNEIVALLVKEVSISTRVVMWGKGVQVMRGRCGEKEHGSLVLQWQFVVAVET